MNFGRAWLLAGLCAFWLGCVGGTETGNPSFQGSLGYDAFSSEPAVVGVGQALAGSAPSVRVNSAWLVLGEVGFVPEDDCDPSAAVAAHVAGLGAGDHVKTQAAATPFEAAAGRYCGVRVALERVQRAPDAEPALLGRSLLVRGSVGNARGTRDFTLASDAHRELFLRATPSFALDATHPAVLLGFDLAVWAELDWASVRDDEDPIMIDADHNPALLADFEQRLARGVSLFRDHARDGLLDRSADEPIAQGQP